MKIVTALTNEGLNERLRKIDKFEVIGKDFQYQEALLEVLEKNKKIDLLVLSSSLPGDLNIYELINIIKYKNQNINIFIILENEKGEIIDYLIKKGINNIFYNNKTTEDELVIQILKYDNREINLPKIKNIQKVKNTFLNYKNIKKIEYKTNEKKLRITIIGSPKVGKSIFSILLSLNIENKKILLIDYDSDKNSLKTIIGKKQEKNIIKYNKNINIAFVREDEIIENIDKYDIIIFDIDDIEKSKNIILKSEYNILLVEPNLLGLKEVSNILELIINKWNLRKENLKIVYNKINIFSINKEILKQLFSDFENLGSIKSNDYYNYIINNNLKVNKRLINYEYKKIAKKLIKKEENKNDQ